MQRELEVEGLAGGIVPDQAPPEHQQAVIDIPELAQTALAILDHSPFRQRHIAPVVTVLVTVDRHHRLPAMLQKKALDLPVFDRQVGISIQQEELILQQIIDHLSAPPVPSS